MTKLYSILAIASILMNEGVCFSTSTCSMKGRSRYTCCEVAEQSAPDRAREGGQSIQTPSCCSHHLVTIGNQTEFLQEQSVSAGNLQPFFAGHEIGFVSTTSVGSSAAIPLSFNHAPPPREDIPILTSALLI